MHICYDLGKLDLSVHHRPVVTMGTFDGVHLGHQEILRRVTAKAGEMGRKSVLLTYHPHPRQVLNPQKPIQLLTTLEEKIGLIEGFEIEDMIVLNFDQTLANTSAREFVDGILVKKLLPGHLVVGYDHGFGKDRQGGIEILQQTGELYDFQVEVVGPVKFKGENISSSKIRKAFMADNFNTAVQMLGHSYPLRGTVRMGTGLGKKLGYPTCNLNLLEDKLRPPKGIYRCSVQMENQNRPGMAYVGTKPTLTDSAELSVEVHIFDFQGTWYDRVITVNLEEWIRPDRRFADLEELRNQITKDEKTIREKTEKREP
jgi:riboflavin kinase/FMN adenylyltransferase